jgi:ribosome-binding protein aMBF1 (putative translation factor)
MAHEITLTIDGKEYVVIPRAEYVKLVGKDLEGAVDAASYARRSLGKSLRAAREVAGLTQAELAKRLKRTQPMVSSAEGGGMRVGPRYIASVLKACGLPANWKAPKKRG